jgi:hypothetical protein
VISTQAATFPKLQAGVRETGSVPLARVTLFMLVWLSGMCGSHIAREWIARAGDIVGSGTF